MLTFAINLECLSLHSLLVISHLQKLLKIIFPPILALFDTIYLPLSLSLSIALSGLVVLYMETQ